jgi:hypothetical protein
MPGNSARQLDAMLRTLLACQLALTAAELDNVRAIHSRMHSKVQLDGDKHPAAHNITQSVSGPFR